MKQIVIISGKGGTGKTVITGAFTAVAKSAVFADCDVDAANLHLILNPEIKKSEKFTGGKVASINQKKCIKCGKCLYLCRFSAVKTIRTYDGKFKSITIDNVSCEGCGVCVWNCPVNAIDFDKKLCGEIFVSDTRYGPFVHARLGIAEENSGKLVTAVKQKAKEIAEKQKKDYVIIDGPPGTGCPVIASLANVDIALIVTEPTVSGIHDMQRIIKLIRHFDIKAAVVINKYDINVEKTVEIKKICKKENLKVVACFPFSEKIIQAIVKRMPFTEFCDGPIMQEIFSLWEKISS